MSCGLLIPSLGGPQLDRCLAAVARLDPAPDRVLVVLSGTDPVPAPQSMAEYLVHRERLGFAAAVNAGLAVLGSQADRVALLNDDAMPDPDWLGVLLAELDQDQELAAVQGTVSDGDRRLIDGRGIALDHYGLATQVDHGARFEDSDEESEAGPRPVLGVSGTAALLRTKALVQVQLGDGSVLDPSFGSYYEDLDLALRLVRIGWRSAWVGGAHCRHLGSVTGRRLYWRHPWWLLANRWRALAGNLTPATLLIAMPRLLRGELRAVRTLARHNPRAVLVAAAVCSSLPLVIGDGWCRRTPGPRLAALPPPESEGGVRGGGGRPWRRGGRAG